MKQKNKSEDLATASIWIFLGGLSGEKGNITADQGTLQTGGNVWCLIL